MVNTSLHFPLITLLSDFGQTDVYVGVMKGVIARICPPAQMIDLTHAIPPQNVALASFQLANAWSYFPDGTIHLAVVDPGVGSQRRAVAIQLETGFLVGPDNGLFAEILRQGSAIAAVQLTHPQYWRTPQPSTTFHGRDLFAPAAAHLANGVPLEHLGEPLAIADLIALPPPAWQQVGQTITGAIQAIDHFGNLITTIPGYLLQGSWWAQVGEQQILSGATYGSVEPGNAISFVGSHGWLEIAVNGGSAQRQLGQNLGDQIQVRLSAT